MKVNFIWCSWIVLTTLICVFFANKILGQGGKSALIIGAPTLGHYQIEMACETCHTHPFGGIEVLQTACTQCHATDLDDARDSHPKTKFTDPRNADRVDILDARYCITCHTEHKKQQTQKMGLTIARDYCFLCHQDIAEERPSHKDQSFASCASAGCHNYHDNRALYQDFLIEHGNQPALLSIAQAVESEFNSATDLLAKQPALSLESSEFQQQILAHTEAAHDWQASTHAAAGVDCGGCHNTKAAQSEQRHWIEKPNHRQCASCHATEVGGFLRGKHGMRLSGALSASLSPISPSQSPLNFKAQAQGLEHGCNACHGAHTFDKKAAAVNACLGCHNDKHSLAYPGSAHGQNWLSHAGEQALSQQSLVTCATCHLPKIKTTINGSSVHTVQHNQNHNLRPNEKMIRSVCMNCHGLAFSIDALADPALIDNNFSGAPSVHIKSIDWALETHKE